MADRPILFSAPMVIAILAGRKSQTRRVLKPQPQIDGDTCRYQGHLGPTDYLMREITPRFWAKFKIGDRLWVREGGDLLKAAVSYDPIAHEDVWSPVGWRHAADDSIIALENAGDIDSYIDDCSAHKRPSIHMPRWASRLTLTVIDVKIERLQDISVADAEAEGCPPCPQCHDVGWINSGPDGGWQCDAPGCGDADVDQYRRLWETINGPGSWAANPWVCAVSFSVERCNIDQGAARAALQLAGEK